MSNDKLAATFGRPTAVVHIHVLYDAVCHECDWESPGSPYEDAAAAEIAAEAHRCPPRSAARHE